jgi:hypothetical protein
MLDLGLRKRPKKNKKIYPHMLRLLHVIFCFFGKKDPFFLFWKKKKKGSGKEKKEKYTVICLGF